MKIYIINSEKDLEKFKDEYGYYVDGNADIKCSLNIGKRLNVVGFIYIEADGSIRASWSIEAGESYGISAGLQILCKTSLTFGLKCFAGVCTWRKISDSEKTITCGEFKGGVVEYGILKETGIEKIEEMTKDEVCKTLGKTIKIKK